MVLGTWIHSKSPNTVPLLRQGVHKVQRQAKRIRTWLAAGSHKLNSKRPFYGLFWEHWKGYDSSSRSALMRSLNFAHSGLPSAVDDLGADAEMFLASHPDLTLLRVCQLSEAQRAKVDEAINGVDPDGLDSDQDINKTYRLAWSLKACHARGVKVPASVNQRVFAWSNELGTDLSLGHLWLVIAGWTSVVFPNAPRPIRLAVKNTVDGARSPLVLDSRIVLYGNRGQGVP